VKRRNRLPKSPAVITLLIGLLVITIALILTQIRDPAVTINVDVELTTSTAGIAELFVNSDDQRAQATVVPGRQTISFTGIEGPLHLLRVDPLAIAAERVTIHRISVFDSEGRQLATYAGQDFASWSSYNAESLVVDPDGLTFTTSTSDPAVTSVVDIQPRDRSKLIDLLVQRWRQPWRATELVLGLPILLMTLGAVGRRRWGAIALIIGPLAVYLAIRLAGSTRGVTPADKAFGRPGFSGLDAAYPRRFVAIALVLVAGLSLLALLFRRQFPWLRRPPRQPTEPDSEVLDSEVLAASDSQSDDSAASTHAEQSDAGEQQQTVHLGTRARSRLRRVQWSRLITILAVPLLYALIRFPSAHQISSVFTAPIPNNGWDYANLRTWEHLLASGSQPMVDFWYPYGNLGYLQLGVIGAVLDWLSAVVCVTAFSSSLWRLSQRATPVIIGTMAVAAFDLQFFTGGVRYLAPLAFTTWFATTRRTKGKERWAALVAVAIAPLISPDVGVYTFAAAAGVLFVDELAVRGMGDRAGRRRILRDCLAIGSGWSAFILLGLIRGSIVPSLALILDVQTTATYVGSITPVAEMIQPIPGRILFVFPFAIIGLAVYAALRRRGRDVTLSWIPALAGLGICGVLVLAKHLIRPGLEASLAVICAAAIAVAIASSWEKVGSATTAMAAGAFVGALVIQANAADSIERWRLAVVETPTKAVELLAAVTWERDETLLYRTTVTRERLAAYQEELFVADAVASLAPGGRMFVLGDSQYLYPITGSRPYWVISGWDASPLREQRRVVEELNNDPPDVVVFDPRDIEYDGVPSELRLPLIYRWVVERYSVHSSVGSYELLTPRNAEQDIDWSYWRQMLGTTLDLGRLPAATTAAGASCDLDGGASDHCLAYLTLEVEGVDAVVTRTITLSGPSGFFRLKFLQQPGDRRLEIPLGRMWFWTKESTVFVPTDWVIDHEMHGARDSVLY